MIAVLFLIISIFLLAPRPAAASRSEVSRHMDTNLFQALPLPALCIEPKGWKCRESNASFANLVGEPVRGKSPSDFFTDPEAASLIQASLQMQRQPRLLLRTRFGPLAVRPAWLCPTSGSPDRVYLMLDPVGGIPRLGKVRLQGLLSGLLFPAHRRGKLLTPSGRSQTTNEVPNRKRSLSCATLAHDVSRVDKSTWAALDRVGQSLGVDRIGIWRLTGPDTFREAASWMPRGAGGASLRGEHPARVLVPGPGRIEPGEVIPLSPSPESPLSHYSSVLAAPIHHGGGMWGLILFCAEQHRKWSDIETQTAVVSAAFLAAALCLGAIPEADRPQGPHRSLSREYPGILLWETDTKSKLVSASDAFYQLVGRVGTAPFGPTGPNSLATCLEQARSLGKFHGVEHGAQTRDGRYLRLCSSGVPIRNRRGQVIGLRGYSVDITLVTRQERELKIVSGALRRTARRLRQAWDESALLADKALAAQAAKQDFLANIGHEVRTPIHIISGMAHLAMQGTCNPIQRAYLEKIHEASASLLGIMNNVLEMATYSQEDCRLECSPMRLGDILETTALAMERQCAQGVQLIRRIDQALPSVLLGDPAKVERIVSSLLHNAVKFTEAGTVSLGCEVGEAQQDTLPVTLTISDTGIGMRSDQVDELTRPFTQADGSLSRRFGGMGVGLALTRKLVRAMNGTLKLASAPGQGTTVTVSLALTVPPASLETRASGSRLLVLATCPQGHSLLRKALEGKDGTTRLCVHPDHFLASLETSMDEVGALVIWLDGEGEIFQSLISGIRQHQRASSLPVIGLSPGTPKLDQGLGSILTAWLPGMNDADAVRQGLAPWLRAMEGKSGPVKETGSGKQIAPEQGSRPEELDQLARLLEEDDADAAVLCDRLQGSLRQIDADLGDRICAAASVFEFSEALDLLRQLQARAERDGSPD